MRHGKGYDGLMSVDDQLVKLRGLIGRQVAYQGNTCRVIELLESDRVLVLRCEGNSRHIQPNQFGEASRRVQQCISLPLFDNESGELLPLILAWLAKT